MELITTSVEAFRTRTLMNPSRTWRPTGGASLKTYFIGRCLMEFPDTYVRWRRAEEASLGRTDALVDDGRHVDDPAGHAVASVRVDELLDPVTRAMFELQKRGYKLQEIAELLTQAGYPHSEASVRTRMTRAGAGARTR